MKEEISKNKKIISFVFPVYNEEGTINELYERISNTLKKIENQYDFEIIFVNDGSFDSSLDLLKALRVKDSRIVIIDLARNFGHQIAITAGLDRAKGDAVIVMDSDLQDPPNICLKMIRKWEKGFEVVYGQRVQREDSFLKKLTASIYYRLLDKLSSLRIPLDSGDFRLMDRKVVRALRKCREHNRFIRGLVTYVGFKQGKIKFNRSKRYTGTTKYSILKMLDLAFAGLLGFSKAPLTLIFIMSFIFIGISILGFGFTFLFALLFLDFLPTAFSLIISSLFFFFGINFFLMAILGEYSGRIYKEVLGRPLYTIAKVYKA